MQKSSHTSHRRGDCPSSATIRLSRIFARPRDFLAHLGPGIITGAADDDPSGISTYSIAGASFGYLPLWLALFSFPLMAAVQLMCERLALVTGRGLVTIIRQRYPRWMMWAFCILLLIANTFNIGADLSGMGEVLGMMTGLPSPLWPVPIAAVIVLLLFLSTYRQIVNVFKWLTLSLFAYVAAAVLSRPDWTAVLSATVVPRISWTQPFLETLVAVLGTTISPYLMVWQASQEVEEERSQGKTTVALREGTSAQAWKRAKSDVLLGMLFSNIVMYFIILTTGATLHVHGQTHIASAREAAEALKPIAGDGASLLFALGIIGTGMLAIPVLAGSAAYAMAEAMQWRGTLDDRPPSSRKFYMVLSGAILLGLATDFLGVRAMAMLFYSAVLNGVLAPPLIVVVVLLTSTRAVMGNRVNSRVTAALGWLTAAFMTAACVALLGGMG